MENGLYVVLAVGARVWAGVAAWVYRKITPFTLINRCVGLAKSVALVQLVFMLLNEHIIFWKASWVCK